jgi:hypothetical protein
MRNISLLIGALVLLVTAGFGQPPEPSSNTGQASIKGCLGGSDGNYTVAQDGTNQILRITASTVDLKPDLGRHVEVIGHEAYVAGGSDHSVMVTALKVISEHCATATARAGAGSIGTAAAAGNTPTATTGASVAGATPTATPGTTPVPPPLAAGTPPPIGCTTCTSTPVQVSPPRAMVPGQTGPVQMPEEGSKIEMVIGGAVLTLALMMIWSKRSWHQGPG